MTPNRMWERFGVSLSEICGRKNSSIIIGRMIQWLKMGKKISYEGPITGGADKWTDKQYKY